MLRLPSQGRVNGQYLTWLEKYLVQQLRPGQWMIIDNATFHHGGRIAQLIEVTGCRVVYLPPYLPDLNRIEKC
ncbi:transposase [Gloeocapsopsis sp. IPPAS B-1203]|uniref:transposase n=1 Tax=Gloeocapsopsis sp. IPPAS B-1203 TaxID=2049454 RepID=UPI000C1933D4|nr:transposase [Gloeocapsopsis sp. IPPAS B-1203]PIG91661.1 hypothetical protein CSQ79_20785 [Gloeocapsopsis sp. IPPAS B-1203]